AGRREIQPDEAEQDRRDTLVQDRPESLRRVADEVGERHLSRDDERDGSSEESDQQQRAPDELEYGREADLRREYRRQRHGPAVGQDRSREGEELRHTVLKKQECRDDPEDALEV